MIGAHGLPEAPASWNVVYTSPQGFRCQLTLRGTDPVEVLKAGGEIMARMQAAGCTPNGGHGNGGEGKVCPVHPGALLRKHEKNGQVWWSHKVEATGEWCRGKPAQGGGQ
jgi:hypothetical protein